MHILIYHYITKDAFCNYNNTITAIKIAIKIDL